MTTTLPLGQVLCGDALETMRTLPSASFAIILTSPPYNLTGLHGQGKSYEGSTWKGSRLLYDGYSDTDKDSMPDGEYVAHQRECVDEMVRLLRPDGVLFYNHKNSIKEGVLVDRGEIVRGFPVRQRITWFKGAGHNHCRSFFRPVSEDIYIIGARGGNFKFHQRSSSRGDVWQIAQDLDNTHPAPFPLALAEFAIRAVDNSGAVLDPFVGSGTTLVAAALAEREWLGIERSQTFADMATARVRTTLPSLF